MTFREVTRTVIKQVEDACGCPVVVSVLTRYATIDGHDMTTEAMRLRGEIAV